MEQEFILTIIQHRYLGWIGSPCISEKNNSAFITIKETLTGFHLNNGSFDLSEKEKEILSLFDKFADHNLTRIFSREKSANDFYSKISLDKFESQVRPYIEENIAKMIDIAHREGIPIYVRKPNYYNLYDADLLTVIDKDAEAVFNFERTPEKFSYFLTIQHQNKTINLLNKDLIVLSNDPCRVILGDKLFCFHDIDAKKLKPFTKKSAVIIPKSAEKKYFETFVLNCIKNNLCEVKGFEIIHRKPQVFTYLFIEENLDGFPILTLKFRYGNRYFLHSGKAASDVSFEDRDGNFRFIMFQRDVQWENQVANALLENGLQKGDHAQFSLPEMPKEPTQQLLQILRWLNINHKVLLNNGVELKQEFYKTKYFTGHVQLSTSIEDKMDWFELHGIVTFGEFKIPFIKLRKHILSGTREFNLPNGEIAIIPEEWFLRYQEIFKFANDQDDILQLDKIHFNLLRNSDAQQEDREVLKDIYLHKADKNIKMPQYLNANLRDYQREGYSWMMHLRKNNFGGCLADDMGLGKTLQTLTLLQKIYEDTWDWKRNEVTTLEDESNMSDSFDLFNQEPVYPSARQVQKLPASLIVMPKSLLHNWENEIRKFCPKLLVYNYTGSKRFRTGEIGKVFRHFNIILTSYGLVRNDLEFIKTYRFYYIILDESHYIKNPTSKAYQAVNQVNAEHRLVITGTPIENSLQDLWAQFNFINKGLLGSMNYFKQHFVAPITKNNDETREARLQKIIQPFILRRTKNEVAKDLPPLTEQILYCEMSEHQKEVYQKEKSGIRTTLLERIETSGIDKSRLMALQGLMRLRLIANHPVLIDKLYKNDSGKFDRIISNIKNLVAEKHKVLVFSSFVKHLRLIEHYLERVKQNYSILTGATQNREEVIRKFQEEDDNLVFLISLKAGGVGLNLTAADYVFILDPWWNPQAEMQAINRAHRIGQEKKVMVYRYITRDSIEEKIVKLQGKKTELANTFINTNNPFKNLSEKELQELFK